MEFPLEIVYRHVPRTEKLDDLVSQRVAKLERLHPRLTGVRVAVEREVERQVKNSAFRVRIELSVPNERLVAVHEPMSRVYLGEEMLVAVRDAFDKAQRQLLAYKNRHRPDQKVRHEAPPHAIVSKVYYQDGYGFLMTPEGEELYFHENAVIDGHFQDLEPGQEVRYAAGRGLEGPSATTVHVIGHSGHHQLNGGVPT